MTVTVSQKTNSERGTVLGGEKHKLSFGYVKFEASFVIQKEGCQVWSTEKRPELEMSI